MFQGFRDKIIETLNKTKQNITNKMMSKNKKASGINIIYFFKNLSKLYYGNDILLKKEDVYRMNGVIKNLKNNNMQDKDIYLFIEYVIHNWDTLVLDYKENVSDVFLTVTPTLPSFFIIKDYCFSRYKQTIEEETIA